jgi:hypothetical protein
MVQGNLSPESLGAYQFENLWLSGDAEALCSLSGMAWATPQFDREEVDAAGATLINPDASRQEFGDALTIINNWRSSHSFPLNTFQVTLRNKAGQIYSRSLIAQRIKRLSSIDFKLRRFDWLRLSDMQDIGGCRAVLNSVAHVDGLVKLYKTSSLKHKLEHEDDYIRNPKRSGYRGVHLIYRYYSDRKDTYKNLKIEIQLRSPLQHAWATSVETVGTFIGQALKSSQGQRDWLRFFALMGCAIAHRERTALVPGTPADKGDLIGELQRYAAELDVVRQLQAYTVTLQAVGDSKLRGAHYYLLRLDPKTVQVTVWGYKARDLESASEHYLRIEREISDQPGADAVLVSVESLAALKRAYPNYFFDTAAFTAALSEALAS